MKELQEEIISLRAENGKLKKNLKEMNAKRNQAITKYA